MRPYPEHCMPAANPTGLLERLILAIRQDFGCFVIVVLFFVVMISTIVFATLITPPLQHLFV